MNGPEISRLFFYEWGLPYIRDHYPQLEMRMAAFLFEKSQAIYADDELSRDHDWGPSFQLILTDADFDAVGEALRERIANDAPDEWRGCRHTFKKSKERMTVDPISGYLKGQLECDYTSPPDDWEFPENVESHLFYIKHGPIFYDPLGELSERRAAFSRWSDAYLDKKIRSCCWNMWHYGRYNFVERMVKRDDPAGAAMCMGEFLKNTMRLCIYLDGDFAPYWKWLSFRFRQVTWASDIISQVDTLAASHSKEEQALRIEEISRLAEAKFAADGLDLEIDN